MYILPGRWCSCFSNRGFVMMPCTSFLSLNPFRNDVTFEGFGSETSISESISFELMSKQNFESQQQARVALKLTSPHYSYVLYLSLSLLKSQSIVLKFLYIVITVLQTAGFILVRISHTVLWPGNL